MYKGEDEIKKEKKKQTGKSVWEKWKITFTGTINTVFVITCHFPKSCRIDWHLFPEALDARAEHSSCPMAPQGLGAQAAWPPHPRGCDGKVPPRHPCTHMDLWPLGVQWPHKRHLWLCINSVQNQERGSPENNLRERNSNLSVGSITWGVCWTAEQWQTGREGGSHGSWQSRARRCLTTSSLALFSTTSLLPQGLQGCWASFSWPSLLPRLQWGSAGWVQSPPTGGSRVWKLSVCSVTFHNQSWHRQDNEQK